MHWRDREGREAAAIAAVADLHVFVEGASGWQGTRIPHALERRAIVAPPPISVDQEVRLRVLRALPQAQ